MNQVTRADARPGMMVEVKVATIPANEKISGYTISGRIVSWDATLRLNASTGTYDLDDHIIESVTLAGEAAKRRVAQLLEEREDDNDVLAEALRLIGKTMPTTVADAIEKAIERAYTGAIWGSDD